MSEFEKKEEISETGEAFVPEDVTSPEEVPAEEKAETGTPETVEDESETVSEETVPEETADAEPVSEDVSEPEDSEGDAATVLTGKEAAKAEKKRLKEEAKRKKQEEKEASKRAKKGLAAAEAEPAAPRKDTVLRRTDAEAHRNKRYTPRGKFSQTMVATGVELKRLRKTLSPLVLVFWAVAILVCANVDQIAEALEIYDSRVGLDLLQYMGQILFLLPIIAVFYCAKAAGTVPYLFRNKVAYLHFALPVSKSSFYLGKLIAYTILTLLMIVIFYVCAYISAYRFYPDELFLEDVAISFALSALAAFALLSMLICFSVNREIPSMLRAIVILLGTYSAVYGVLHLIYEKIALNSAVEAVVEKAMEYVGYLPMNGFDFALEYIGADGFYSGKVLAESFSHAPELLGLDWMAALGVYFVWGILFLVLGLRRFSKKEL